MSEPILKQHPAVEPLAPKAPSPGAIRDARRPLAPKHAGFAAQEAALRPDVAGQDPALAPAAGGQTAGAAAGGALPAADRASLISITIGRLGLAYTAFVSACHANARALERAARAKAELVGLLADVAMGFLTPGLASGAINLLDRLPVSASARAHQIAYVAMNPDLLKAGLSGATKSGVAAMKVHATKLFGETEADGFLRSLEVSTQVAFDTVMSSLSGRTDTAIIGVWATYDPKLTNANSYAASIEAMVARFESEVLTIGKWGRERGAEPETAKRELFYQKGLVAVPLGGEWVLVRIALIGSQRDRHGAINGPNTVAFLGFVDESMRGAAVERALALQPGGIATLPASKVQGLPRIAPRSAARHE